VDTSLGASKSVNGGSGRRSGKREREIFWPLRSRNRPVCLVMIFFLSEGRGYSVSSIRQYVLPAVSHEGYNTIQKKERVSPKNQDTKQKKNNDVGRSNKGKIRINTLSLFHYKKVYYTRRHPEGTDAYEIWGIRRVFGCSNSDNGAKVSQFQL
jgi:hypothetical protein